MIINRAKDPTILRGAKYAKAAGLGLKTYANLKGVPYAELVRELNKAIREGRV